MSTARAWHLKAPLHFQHGKTIDPDTCDVRTFDRFLADWIDYACAHGILPNNYSTIKLLDSTGTLARMSRPGHPTRAPNYPEYAAMSQSSVWWGAVMVVECTTNVRDGGYYNTTSAQIVTPAKFLYKLEKSDTPPVLKMPFDNLCAFMRGLRGGSKTQGTDVLREAECDMDCDYAETVAIADDDDEIDEREFKRQRVHEE